MATESHSDTWNTGASDLRAVSTLAQLLAGAIKHHTLYPEDHSIARRHISKIHETFSLFFKNHKTLHIDIGKNALLYDGDVVFQGKADENDIAFLLGRDGVEWMEFSRDIERWEIQSLLRIINNNRRSDAENDGNISNALWEKDFPHIEYKTLDLMAMDLPFLDLGSFRVAPAGDTTTESESYWKDDDFDTDEEENEETGIALTAPGNALWNLSILEEHQLKTMVEQEENREHTESTIGILFILLLTQNDRQEVAETLAFLQDRFLYCLQHRQITYALQIIRTLTKIEAAERKRRQWISPLILDLISTVSRPESLRDLESFFSTPEKFVPESELKALWTLLRILPPDILKTLAPLSHTIDHQYLGASFLGLFEHFAVIDSPSLAAVIPETHKDICLGLFPFILKARTYQAIPILTAMALHSSPQVRGKAFSLLVEWDEVDPGKLFPLINDPDETIRSTILSLAGKKRHADMERMLRNYLEKYTGDTKDRDHILASYQTLGKSGSAASIPFLKKILFHGSSLGTLFAAGGGVHKEGAAQALLALHLPEARAIIEEGATHILPDVRAACRKALGKRHA